MHTNDRTINFNGRALSPAVVDALLEELRLRLESAIDNHQPIQANAQGGIDLVGCRNDCYSFHVYIGASPAAGIV